jgi:hypothetical protein
VSNIWSKVKYTACYVGGVCVKTKIILFKLKYCDIYAPKRAQMYIQFIYIYIKKWFTTDVNGSRGITFHKNYGFTITLYIRYNNVCNLCTPVTNFQTSLKHNYSGYNQYERTVQAFIQ